MSTTLIVILGIIVVVVGYFYLALRRMVTLFVAHLLTSDFGLPTTLPQI